MAKRKNLLLICTDHWPSYLMGCAGHPVVMTPTLDSLAHNGVRFDHYYSECPVCIPARRSMMTGLSPRHHGDRVYSDRMTMPDVTTLAGAFHDAGYQTYAVGKLHVYPQRDRIGFDDVSLQEEGRYEFGTVDDYQVWLGEQGYVGQEYTHGMGNNAYYTRTWHLPEETHPTNWATREMCRQIKRKDPTRPAFYYLSYQFPHPPLVPLQSFWDMYRDEEIDEPWYADWNWSRDIFRLCAEQANPYTEKERIRARRAFYAQCTHLDNQIRIVIGTLRECNLLDDTIIVFTSDHGDMLFNHGMVAKRSFYEPSACVPLIISGKPFYDEYHLAGETLHKLGVHADLMPTLLDLCGVPAPEGMDGLPLMSNGEHPYVYGEIGTGIKATRMVRKDRYKLIYYPYGNVIQLFDMEADPHEKCDLAADPAMMAVRDELCKIMMSEFYGSDMEWIRDGVLVGMPEEKQPSKPDFGLYNQRGYHWPVPQAYSNLGKNQ
ncbi:MAG: sulfatase-like hydrolase/transferase [Firmicutes bacterium]|nr:sulfatase-like hydrolase/transferase [Bacillota bacterium]